MSGTVTTEGVAAEPIRAMFPTAAGAEHLLQLDLAFKIHTRGLVGKESVLPHHCYGTR